MVLHRFCVVFPMLWLCCLLIRGSLAASLKEYPLLVPVSERSDIEGSGEVLTPESGDDSIFSTLLIAVVLAIIVMGGLIVLCLLGICTVCIIMYFRRNRDPLPENAPVVYTNPAFEEYTGSTSHQPDQDSYSFTYSPMPHQNACSSVCNSLPSLFQASCKWAIPTKSSSEGDRLDATVLGNKYMLQPGGSLPRDHWHYPEQTKASAQCDTCYSTPV